MTHLQYICFIFIGLLLGIAPSKADTMHSDSFSIGSETLSSSYVVKKDTHLPLQIPQKRESNSEKKEEGEREFNEKENNHKETFPSLYHLLHTQQSALEPFFHAFLHFQELKNSFFSASQIYILHQVWRI